MKDAALPLEQQRPSWVTMALPAILLALVTAGVYLPAIQAPMIFDDQPTLVGPDSLIHTTFENPWSLLQSARGLTSLTFVLNHWLDGTCPMGYRLTNLLLHILAGWVLLDLTRRTLSSPRFHLRWVNNATTLAVIIAGLWMLHPLHTQAVTYIVQRSEVMATLFLFIALDALAMAAGGGRAGKVMKAVAILACIAAMYSKEIGYLTPVLLFLYDRTFWGNTFKDTLRTRPIFYALLAATFILPWWQGLGGYLASPEASVAGSSAGLGVKGLSPWLYFFSQQSVLVHYLGLIFWPKALVLDYRLGVMEPAAFAMIGDGAHILSLAIMLTLGVVTLWLLWRRPAWGFLGAWFFLLMAPTSSFLPIVDLVMEHRVYAASAAVIAAVVMTVALLFEAMVRRWPAMRDHQRLIAILLVFIVASALCARTWERNESYNNPVMLWDDTLEHRPANTRAMLILGRLVEPRQPTLTLELYRRAARLEPTNYEPMISLGSYLLMSGQPEEAQRWYEMSHRISGDEPTYLMNMGLLAEARRDLPAAAHFLQQALRASPRDVRMMANLGMVMDQMATQRLKAGDREGALSLREKTIDLLRQALARDRNWQPTRVNLGIALKNLGLQWQERGDAARATDALQESLQIHPQPDTARRLAWLLATWPQPLTQDWAAVVGLAARAEDEVDGRQPVYLDTLAAAMARAGNYEQAVQIQQHAIDIAAGAGIAPAELEPYRQRLARYKDNKPWLQGGR